MGRFSDSPYFLLDAFFDGLSSTEPTIKPIFDFKWSPTFVSSFDNSGARRYDDEQYTFDNTVDDGDDVVFTNFAQNGWNREEYYDPNIIQTFNSYIISPFINISGKGGGIMDLFVKEKDKGYQPITVRYDHTDGNEFHFINSGVKEYDPGDNIIDIISGRRFLFTFWDKVARDTFNLFGNDKEAYFRKDSLYHDFLKVYAKDMMIDQLGVELDVRHYVNTDKLFSYFHNIFKSHDEQKCRIIFYGMKDYVLDAVPEHQRTPRFIELCNIFFDQLYQEIFDLLKNIWTLIDPMEVDYRYVGYLSQYYDMFDVDIEGATLLHVREFVRDMVWMIKRKGTYTEFYILWRILTATKNILNVYERWHRRDVEGFPMWPSTISPPCTGTWPNAPYYSNTQGTTNVPPSAYRDVLYVYRPEYDAPTISGGAGPGWYNKWYPEVYDANYISPSASPCVSGTYLPSPVAPSGDNLMLSTQYILETDISSEPLASDAILTKVIWDQMWKYWEYVRPVNRVSNYRILEAPITDISGKYIHLYNVSSKSSAFLKTKSNVTFDLAEGSYVHDQTDNPSDIWNIFHNLGEDVLLQVFDNDFNEIIPKEITYTTSNAIIEFEIPEAGFAIVRQADWADTRPLPVLSFVWKLNHLRLEREVIIHYKKDEDRFYALDTELTDINYADATLANLDQNEAVVGAGNYIFTQTTPVQEWNIPHDMGMKGVLMSVYTPENVRIHPNQYELVDGDNCILRFNEPTVGYVVLINVGDLSIEDLLLELDDLISSMQWVVFDYDELGNRVELERGPYVRRYHDDNYYYFDFDIPKESSYIINEIDLLDKNGDVLLNSMMSDLYKPYGVDMVFHYRLMIPTNN